jgi:hypothetical protein
MTILKHLLPTYLFLRNINGVWFMVRIDQVAIWASLAIHVRWAKQNSLPDTLTTISLTLSIIQMKVTCLKIPWSLQLELAPSHADSNVSTWSDPQD